MAGKEKGLYLGLFLLFLILIPVAADSAPWFNSSWHVRVPINVSYPSGNENLSINVTLNFTSLFSSVNMSGATLDYPSLRVLENLSELPLEYNNLSAETIELIWIANGSVGASNRTFYVYFDSVSNGPKPQGESIREEPRWRSGYKNSMNDYSPWINDTTGTAAIPYNRSWAKRVEVSFKWAAEPASGDRMRLYVDGAQKGSDRTGTGSANESYWGNSTYGRFVSDAFGSFPTYGASDAYGVYGAAIDFVRFYPVRNYTVVSYSLVRDSAEAEPTSLFAAVASASYNFNETAEISGTLLDSGGAPVSGATVNATLLFPNASVASTMVNVTNSSGGYRIGIFLPWGSPNGTYNVSLTAVKSSFNSSANQTSFFYTADKIPTLSDFSVSPGIGGWNEYFNFSVNVSDFDDNPDFVNVSIWVNTSGGLVKYFEQSILPPTFANWTIKPFLAGDVGTNRTYFFEFEDSYHSISYNTTETPGPEVERDDVSIVFFLVNNTPVPRPGSQNVTFGAGLFDLDNQSVVALENLSFWSDSLSGWIFASINSTGADGNSTVNFDPTCAVPAGGVSWKANFSGNSLLKANESDFFGYSTIGQLQVNLTYPEYGSRPAQGDPIFFQANVTDECVRPVTGASANFTIANSSTFYCFGEEFSGGLYNCTWNSAGAPAGNYSITIDSDRADYYANSTVFPIWFYLRTGPPAVIFYISPYQFDQLASSVVNVSVTDFSGMNLTSVVLNATSPSLSVYTTPMTLFASEFLSGSWVFNYTATFPGGWGNSTEKGNYSLLLTAIDGVGSVGNRTANITVYTHVNLTSATDLLLYEPGSFGSVQVQATDSFGAPLQNLQANLSIAGPSGSPLFFLSDPVYSIVTNSLGLASTPAFFISSGAASASNYTLSTVAQIYEPLINGNIFLNRTYNFIVQRPAPLQIVPNINSRIFTNREMHVGAITLDRATGAPASVDNLTISLYYLTEFGPVLWRQLTLANLTESSPGIYDYYATAATNTTGNYYALFNATKYSTSTLYAWPFEVTQGGPFDVAVQAVNSPVPAGSILNFDINITNMGPTDQFDVNLTYWIDDGTVYRRQEPVRVFSYQKSVYSRQFAILPTELLGVHNLTVRVDYDSPSSPAIASDLFIVTFPSATTTVPAGGGGGGGGFGGGLEAAGPITTTTIYVKPTVGLSITDYPRERDLFVERNSVRFFNIGIKNEGTTTLHDISVNVSGIPPSWFEIVSSTISFLDSDGTATFVVRLVIPSDAKAQVYPITIGAYANETSAEKVTAVSIFASEKERLFYEIQFLKGRYGDLEDSLAIAVQNRKNVSDVIDIMAQAKLQIDTAGKFVDEGALRNAGDAIRKANNYLDRAEFELNRIPQELPKAQPVISLILPVTAFPYIIALLILLLGIIVIIWIARTLRRVKTIVKVAAAKEIKAAMESKTKTPAELIRSRERIRKLLSMLDGQLQNKLISKETYEELKRENARKLAALNKELGMEE